VPYDLHSNAICFDKIENVVGKSLEIDPAKPAFVEVMRFGRTLNCGKDLQELTPKTITQSFRNRSVILDRFLDVVLDARVKA